jgi:hypothetical protein
MTDQLTETDVTKTLDQQRGPAVYALAVAVPDDIATVRERWDRVCDVRHAQLKRLASAERVAYVGASESVYHRLCDHAAGESRQATLLQAFAPTRIIDVWWCDHPYAQEYSHAVELSQSGWCAYTDGEVVG